MPKSSLKIFLVFSLCILLLIFASVTLKLDFSKSDFVSSDILDLLPFSGWIYLAGAAAIVLMLYFSAGRRFLLAIPLLLGTILAVIYPLAQYPAIYNQDSFLHGETSVLLAEYAHIPYYRGYFQYPGAFLLSSTLSEVLGIPVIETDLILSSFLILTSLLFLFVLGKMFRLSDRSWLVPTIFLVFSFRFYTSLLHFSPQLLGFFLYILFVYLLVRRISVKSRSLVVMLVLCLSALTIVHSFSMIFALFGLFSIFLLQRIRPLSGETRSPYGVNLVILALASLFFLSWSMFDASIILHSALNFLSLLARGAVRLGGMGTVLVESSGPFRLVTSVYRYGIYLFFGALSFLGFLLLKRKLEVRLMSLLALGLISGGIFIYFTPAEFGVGRAVIFGGIVIGIFSALVTYRISAGRKILKIFEMLCPLLLISTFVITSLSACTYTAFIHSDEMSAAKFAGTNIHSEITAVIDDVFVIQFYSPESLTVHAVDDQVPAIIAVHSFNISQASFQYLPRQRYYYGFDFAETNQNIVYSNGLGRIYMQPHN